MRDGGWQMLLHLLGRLAMPFCFAFVFRLCFVVFCFVLASHSLLSLIVFDSFSPLPLFLCKKTAKTKQNNRKHKHAD